MHFQYLIVNGGSEGGEAVPVVDGAQRVGSSGRLARHQAAPGARFGFLQQNGQVTTAHFRHIAGHHEVPVGIGDGQCRQETASRPEGGLQIVDHGVAEATMAEGIPDDRNLSGRGEDFIGYMERERLSVEGEQRLILPHPGAPAAGQHKTSVPHEKIIALGKNDKSGYNRLKQKMHFCFRALFCCSAGVSMFAASLSAGKTVEPTKARAQSVVRVDPATGRLVRVVRFAGTKAAAATAAREVHTGEAHTGDVRTLVENAARSHDVDPLLVESVIQTESAYQQGAVSPKGAQGLMQLMPATARRFGVSDAFDPKENIEGGVKYLKYLQDLFQDDRLAIAAYNAGEGAVAKYNGVPPYKETVAYVEKVAKKYGKARREAAPSVPVAEALNAGLEESPQTRPVIAYTDSQGRLHMTTQ